MALILHVPSNNLLVSVHIDTDDESHLLLLDDVIRKPNYLVSSYYFWNNILYHYKQIPIPHNLKFTLYDKQTYNTVRVPNVIGIL